MLDKGVCTNILQEGSIHFVEQSIESCQKGFIEETVDQNYPDFTDDVGHRCVIM